MASVDLLGGDNTLSDDILGGDGILGGEGLEDWGVLGAANDFDLDDELAALSPMASGACTQNSITVQWQSSRVSTLYDFAVCSKL